MIKWCNMERETPEHIINFDISEIEIIKVDTLDELDNQMIGRIEDFLDKVDIGKVDQSECFVLTYGEPELRSL